MSNPSQPDPLFTTYFLAHLVCWVTMFISTIVPHWPSLVASAVGLAVSAFMLWVINDAD